MKSTAIRRAGTRLWIFAAISVAVMFSAMLARFALFPSGDGISYCTDGVVKSAGHKGIIVSYEGAYGEECEERFAYDDCGIRRGDYDAGDIVPLDVRDGHASIRDTGAASPAGDG